MIEYLGIVILALFAGALASLFIVLASTLGPKRPNPVKDEPFECGEKPLSSPKRTLPVHFYLIAMLFIIFDVELAFLFPWAVLFKKLGLAGLIEMAVFVFFILVGYVYALKKGAIDPE
ncbi:MAG: NADH-quinone oxidoreductase subunit A [Candidatus Omnitrophica bacterium]|nr:NADH-quinone oxidoreductase subunit A [Candidatus Omnitrophota bacterium]